MLTRRRSPIARSLALAVGLLVAACTAPAPPTLAPAIPSGTPQLPTTPPPTARPTASLSPSPTSPATPTTTPTSSPTTSPTASQPSPSARPGELPLREGQIARHLDALAGIAGDNGGRRAGGTSGYDASADYVAQELAALGYAVERQPVDVTFFDERAPVSLAIGDESWTGADWLHAMLYSAGGEVAGELEAVGIAGDQPTTTGGCFEGDWNAFERGRIAVVLSGPCPRRDQVVLAQDAGAVALIGVYPAWGFDQIRRPTLFVPAGIDIPVVAAGSEPGAALLAGAATNAQAEIAVEVEMSAASDDNVIAELAGETDAVVMLGGHLDSSLDGPGINDNGSGAATLLAIAAALADQQPLERTVRLAFWAAEEYGAHGSAHYVDSLSPAGRDRIEAYLNLDMVASPNAARYVYDSELAAPGSSQVTQALLQALSDIGRPGIGLDLGAGSDHAAFQFAGIATGGVFSGIAPLTDEEAATFGGEVGVAADPCYHLACDDRANVSVESARVLGSAILRVVENLAN